MNKSVLRRALVGVIMLTVSLLASAQGGSISVKATKIWDGKEYVWTSSFSYSFKGLIDVKQVGERIDTLNATSFEQGYDGTSYLVVREYSAKIHDGERAAFTLGWTGFSGPPASAVRQMYSDIPIYLGVRPWDLASAKAKACKLGEGYPSITDSIKGSYSLNPDNNTHDHTLETQSNTGYIGSGGTVYLDGVGGYKRGQPNVLISHCKVILHLTHLPKREGAMDDETEVLLDENDDVGPVYEEDTDAWHWDGAWDFAIPASVLIALLGYTLTKGNPKKDGDEDPKHPDRRELRIYKAFGDTLYAGDDPQQVFAKVVRKPKGGGEVTDTALTALLKISAGDSYMQVRPGGMHGDWKTAWISAPEAEQVPEDGIVDFAVANTGGSYTNHLHFQIDLGEIVFGQDNLTLPARYEKEVHLPFKVKGMNDGTATIRAAILDEHGAETQDYSIKITWNEKDQCYYAIINDRVLDPKADEGIAGNYLDYTIRIEASKKGSRAIKGTLPLYRYYMGLAVRMKSDVHCYLEEYNPMHHESGYKTTLPDGKEYVPAQQSCELKVYDYDDEKNELYVIDPKPENIRWKWTVKDIADQGGAQKVLSDIIGNETTQMGLDVALVGAGLGSIGTLVSHAHSRTFKDYNVAQQRLLELQKQLNDIGLRFHPRWQSAGEGHVYYMLCCTGGVLNAPNRFDAELEVTAVHKGKVHTFKRTVHILSQPKREFKTYAEQKAALAHDDKVIEGLWSIESGIQAAGLNARMAPLLYFVRLQIDFYHQDYGYDARNIEAIKNVYLHVLQREADEAGVKAAEATACDNLKWYQLDWWLQRSLEGHEYLEKIPLAMRIGFAVASLGFTEIVYEVPYQMKKYIDEGGESTLGAFKVGAVVAVKAYAIEAAVGLGLGAAGAVGKGVLRGVKGAAKGTAQAVKVAAKESVKAGGRVAKEAMKDALKAAKETMKSEACTGLKTFLKKQVILHEKGVLEKALEHETKALLESVKKVAGGSKYATAEAFAKRQAVENIENLQTMIELCHWHPTVENVRLRNQLIMRCQADKQTMLLLKTPRLLGDDPLLQGLSLKVLKKDFNGLLRKIYTETDELVKADLAIAGKMPIDKIKILGATSSSADDLAKGLNITFDRDVTYYYVLNGKPHYFSQTYVEKLYAKHFRNVVNSRTLAPSTTGFNPSQLTPQALKSLEEMEAKQAAIAARLYDQTVVEDVARHFESYGEDLNRMVNPELHGEALKNPTKVAEAVLHKGTSRFDYADELWRQAELADSVVQKEILEAQAVSEMMEGCRQIKKVFDIIKARDAVRNTYSKIPDEVNRAVDILRNLNGVETKLSQAEAALAQKGFTFRSLSQAVSDAVIQVG